MPPKHRYPVNENRLIRQLQARYAAESPFLLKGIGDDAAVILPEEAKEFWVVTTDMLLEGVDFHREWITPRRLGRKSIAVNLSDLAAMGARPRFFTVSLAIPPGIPERWILQFHDGLADGGESSGARLIGGDLSRAEKHVVISITAFGESLNRKVLYRSGGKAGDLLYVTGVLGRSAAGLKLLEAGETRPRARFKKEALRAHHEPDPRCETGLWLAQSGLVSCAMDLSDGLSADLPRLCHASGTGAEIRISDLPVFAQSALWGCDPVDLALHGGEDYELLFAVPDSQSGRLEQNYPAGFPPIRRIGRMSGDIGRVWISEEKKPRRRLPPRGFDHFARRLETGK